mgnify:CR=1 FL=1
MSAAHIDFGKDGIKFCAIIDDASRKMQQENSRMLTPLTA